MSIMRATMASWGSIWSSRMSATSVIVLRMASLRVSTMSKGRMADTSASVMAVLSSSRACRRVAS